MLPIAVDAMGGDNAPHAIIAGARRASEENGIPVVLVGRPDEIGDTGGLPVIPASEVIAMDADPSSSVRTMKDSSLVRAAEAVRDGDASAMISAGNTGATMASALLRTGRIKGVSRPAIATPIPGPSGTPTVLLDAGANAECKEEWLVQFAQMGAIFARARFGVAKPRIGLLSIGEEAGKGSPFVKETWKLLDDVDWQALDADFIGNVALKTLEGCAKNIVGALLEAFESTEETKAAAEQLYPALLPLYQRFDADSYGGAMLLGTKGPCIISHGSSGEDAMANAISVATDMVELDVVGQIHHAING